MPNLPSDFPDDVPDDLREWLQEDYGTDWEAAVFHGSSEGYWSIEIFYPDGTSSEMDVGYFEGEPDEWLWDLYSWLDTIVDDDVSVDYE